MSTGGPARRRLASLIKAGALAPSLGPSQCPSKRYGTMMPLSASLGMAFGPRYGLAARARNTPRDPLSQTPKIGPAAAAGATVAGIGHAAGYQVLQHGGRMPDRLLQVADPAFESANPPQVGRSKLPNWL
jgi:hypothetical protein